MSFNTQLGFNTIIREVEARKFTMQDSGALIPSVCRCFWRVKEKVNRHSPFSASRIERNALESRLVILIDSAIGSILLTCCLAEIVALIVQSASVFVVNLLAVFCIHDGAVHEDGFSVLGTHGITAIFPTGRNRRPIILFEPFIVGVIDQRVKTLINLVSSVMCGKRYLFHDGFSLYKHKPLMSRAFAALVEGAVVARNTSGLWANKNDLAPSTLTV